MENKITNFDNDKTIIFKAKFNTKLFPRDKAISSTNPYGVLKWDLVEVIEGTIPNHSLLVTGDWYLEPEDQLEYILEVTEKMHRKYGLQYELLSWRENIDFSKMSQQQLFLKTFLTDRQIDNLYNLYTNPLEIIANKDVEALIKVKGVQKITAQKIIERFENSKANAELFTKLGDLGLTTTFISNLLSCYHKNIKVIIDKVRNHPYDLAMEMDGVGFTKADDLAMKVGIPPNSPERIKGFIVYKLEEKAQEGNSYVYAKELMIWIYEQFGGKENILTVYRDEQGNIKGNNISTAIDSLVEDKILCVEDNEQRGDRRVYLYKYYFLELETAYHLQRLSNAKNNFDYKDWKDKIKKQEEKQGWTFTQEQIDGIKLGLEKQVCFITGGAGCVDADTEFFTGKGWKRIADYQEGDKVLQYNEDGTSSLIIPQRYIKEPCKELWHFETDYGINQTVCDEHRIVYWNQEGAMKECSIEDIVAQQTFPHLGWKGQFETAFRYNGVGLPYSDAEIRSMITMVIKEGLTKPYDIFTIHEKKIIEEWYNCTYHQLEVICKEILKANKYCKTFKGCNETVIDFIQFAFHSCGYRAVKKQLNEKNKESNEYILSISSNHRVGLKYIEYKNRTMPRKVSTIDGYKYCFTVDSHMLVLRRQGNIFITGNCGKSSLVSGILSVLSKYSFAQCSLSGKAAARLKEVTGQDGYTIHRLLGYRPGQGFDFNEENPLDYDIIIIDEISLIGGQIFLTLLKAIKSGTKVFILGDMGQLESIGCMNLASDLFKSVNIPTKELKTVHRQAKKSGIIVSSQDIREGEQIFGNSFEGEEIVGEKKDMIFDICPKEEVLDHTIKRFIHYYEQPHFDIMDVQLISPVKDRGGSSVYALNTEIQKIVNPVLEGEKNLVIIPVALEKSYKIHRGDKVLCTKNCYDIETVKRTKTDIYNGWIGTVEEIEDYSETIVIYFPLINQQVIIPYSKKDVLTLGYAITCHKMQGASAKNIIGVLDFSTPPMMLTKELLYTMITRAEKECVIVGQNRAIRKAIDQSGISNKKTFLLEMLDKKENIEQELKENEGNLQKNESFN